MNAYVAHHSSPPPATHDDNIMYRAPQSAPRQQYPTHANPPPSQQQQSHIPPYPQYDTPRGPPLHAAHMHGGDGLAPLAPGTQPIAPDPLPRSLIQDGRRYELKVVQEPRRARMCGFGDKDRRPITPPPCVRLVITDASTGKEMDCNEIDHCMFVLNVDLWSADGNREVNLVRHSATSPSISATSPVSFGELASGMPAPYPSVLPAGYSGFKQEGGGYTGGYNPYPNGPHVTPHAHTQSQQTYGSYQGGYSQGSNGAPTYPPQNGGYSQGPPQQVYMTTGAGIHSGAGAMQSMDYPSTTYNGRNYPDINPGRGPGAITSTPPTGMFTRNLIGSLAASAFRLTDPDDRIGIWFVLQDLSVRTEGNFRLRFSFVNVGVPGTPVPGQNTPLGAPMTVNTGRAPVLAACFSEVFTVYSAKRFPGVVESTPLSKCFATQGIKIPIRKDGPSKNDKNRDDYEED